MDPRAAQTIAALDRAMLDLAAERDIDEIPVTELVARAGVNRSSFYQHYSSREELLAQALDRAAEAAATLPASTNLPANGEAPAQLVEFLQHFADHAAIYRRALGPRGSTLVAARVKARTYDLAREGIQLTVSGPDEILPLDVQAAGVAGALLGALEAWLNRDPLPGPETAGRWILRLLTAGPADGARYRRN